GARTDLHRGPRPSAGSIAGRRARGAGAGAALGARPAAARRVRVRRLPAAVERGAGPLRRRPAGRRPRRRQPGRRAHAGPRQQLRAAQGGPRAAVEQRRRAGHRGPAARTAAVPLVLPAPAGHL
ncbi:MAG: hypothetical protein AVDCRST_MAG16-1257, partial [uncultured Frankineae bacterium]